MPPGTLIANDNGALRRQARPDLRLRVLTLKFVAALTFWGVVAAFMWSR